MGVIPTETLFTYQKWRCDDNGMRVIYAETVIKLWRHWWQNHDNKNGISDDRAGETSI